jgi:hypothetical protein
MVARIMAVDAWRWLAQFRQSYPQALGTVHNSQRLLTNGEKRRLGHFGRELRGLRNTRG